MLLLGVVAAAVAGAVTMRRSHMHRELSTPCIDLHLPLRDPKNPLALPTAPGANPLHGAQLFVDGPRHGAAAGAIASLLGLNPSNFPDGESWTSFVSDTVLSDVSRNPSVARDVRLLEKIASEPEIQRFSDAAEGGTLAGLSDFARKLFCHNFTADRGSVPVITTDFLHPAVGGCPTAAAIESYAPLFMRRVNVVANATGNRPVVYLLEIDAIGSSSCIARHGGLPAWEGLLRYEVDRFAALPHAVVYVEGGYADSNSPRYTARILNAVDVNKIRGFFTNDTHDDWTINEIRWGQRVSRLTHGSDFIVNTAENGNGPKLVGRHESLCNPPGRALGPAETTATGFAHVDAFLWLHVPGLSSGTCGGGPPANTFWPARAISLAARANGRLGPHYPSAPY
jgi:hypothetical protein